MISLSKLVCLYYELMKKSLAIDVYIHTAPRFTLMGTNITCFICTICLKRNLICDKEHVVFVFCKYFLPA